MSDATERLLVRIDATTEQLRRELKRADQAVAASNSQVERAVSAMGRQWSRADKWVQRHSTQLKLVGVAAAAGFGVALKSIVDYSDNYKQLRGQLGLVTSSQAELNQVWQRSLSLSNATGASLDSTVNLYARLARSTQELGLSQDQLFTITKAVNQSFVVSGASAQEADSAILQLSQGLAAGALRGEELNSVMENSPRLARALADGLGVGIGQLRQMGADGELTAERVTTALQRMAGEIDSEFAAMPMTVARATNEIRNNLADAFGKADTEPLIKSVEELGKTLSDPAVIDGLTELAAAIVDVGAAAATAASHLPNFYKWITGNGESLVDLQERLHYANEELALLEKNVGGAATPRARELKAEIERLTKAIEEEEKRLNAAMRARREKTKADEKAADTTQDVAVATEQYSSALQDAKEAHQEAQGEMEKGHQILDKMTAQTEDYIQELQFELDLVGKTEREQFILNKVRQAGVNVTTEQAQRIREAAAALYDESQAAQAATKETKDLVDASADAAKEMERAWADSRELLSDFFFEMARDGKNAFDTLVDGFKAMIAKMVAEAAANQILLGIGGIAGGMGFSGLASAATAAGGGGGGILSGISSAGGVVPWLSGGFSNITGTINNTLGGTVFGQNSSLFTNQGLQMAVPGDGGAALGPQFSWANAGWSLAGGFTGSYLGRQAFGGNTTGTGATVGGIAGTMIPGIGPFLGSAIGSFVGEGLETVLGNILGFGGESHNRVRTEITNGVIGDPSKRGNGRHKEQMEAIEGLTPVLDAIIASIGGTNFSGRVSVSAKNGFELNGDEFRTKDSEEFIRRMFQEFVDGAEHLDDRMRDLLLSFQGTIEQTVEFAAAIRALDEMSGINSVTQAMQDFTAEQPTMAEAIIRQTGEIQTLMANFDGSASAATELANALATNKAAAYEFAIAIQQMGAQLDMIATDQAASIRESVMTPEELRALRMAERDTLFASLETLTDPQEIEAATRRILELNRLVFNSLDEAARLTQAEDYATFAETTNDLAQGLLENALDGLQASQEDMNARISSMLDDTAERQREAAEISLSASENMVAAVDQFSRYVSNLTRNGIPVTLSASELV